MAVHLDDRIVIRVGEILDRPIHARGKIVLKSLAPAPDRRLIGGVTADRICGCQAEEAIAPLRPDRPRLARRGAQHVAATPAAPVRVIARLQPVGDQSEERWGIALHDEHEARIMRAERALAHIGIEPFVGDRGEIGALAVAVEMVARNASPGGAGVVGAVGVGGADHVEQARKRVPDPRPGIVLVADRIDRQLRHQRRELVL